MPTGPRALRRAVVAASSAAFVLAGAVRADEAPPPSGWLTFGGGASRVDSSSAGITTPAALRATWFAPVDGFPTTQPLVARGVPDEGSTTVYAASSTGEVFAFAPNGYLRWRVDLGRYAGDCPQLDAYGVTGTPAIDPSTRALYVADAFGRLHALDLATGSEHPRWRVVLYEDYERELVWGALSAASSTSP